MDWKVGILSGIISLFVSVGFNLISQMHLKRFDKQIEIKRRNYTGLSEALDKLLSNQEVEIFKDGKLSLESALSSSNKSLEVVQSIFGQYQHLYKEGVVENIKKVIEERNLLYFKLMKEADQRSRIQLNQPTDSTEYVKLFELNKNVISILVEETRKQLRLINNELDKL